jgi:hypothetical protein
MMPRRGLPVRRCRRRALGRVRLALCYWSLVAALGAGLVGLYFAYGYRGEYLRAAPFAYPPEPGGESCAGGRGAVAGPVRPVKRSESHSFSPPGAHTTSSGWAKPGR